MAWYPGAIRKEITKFRTPLRRRRGVCLHVAVSEGQSLYSYFSGAKVCSHFYVRKDGTIEQYVSTAYQAPANYQGNSSLISVETQGGVRNANSEPWTAAQVEALARIAAWASKTHGIPLIEMPNSKSTSVGIGYHRQGVDPYRVSGGEKWSTAYGKICPGQGKINQIPQIVNRARQILAGDGELPDTGTPEEPFTVSQYEEIIAKLDYVQEQNRSIAREVEYSQKQNVTIATKVDGLITKLLLTKLGSSGPNVAVALQGTYKALASKFGAAAVKTDVEEK